MQRALRLAALASMHRASATYGDCSCTCCSYAHPGYDCAPQTLGVNTLQSCNQCTINFCASSFAACPNAPTSGGSYGLGGHTLFSCDGSTDVVVKDAEYGGGGLGIVLLLVLIVGCVCCRGRFGGSGSSGSHYVPAATLPTAYAQPVSQPAYGAPPQIYGQGGMYAAPQPTVYSAPPVVMPQPMPPVVVLESGGRRHDHYEHHSGHGGGFHVESHATHTSGGF